MNTNRIFLALFGIYLLGFMFHASLLHKTVYGDGIFYYSWVRSAIVDGDIDFANEYKAFHTSQPIMPTGLPGNKYSIGASILWYPWFLWMHTLIRKTGYESIYQYGIGVVSVLYACTGLVLLFRTLRKFYSESISLASCVAIALGTNLLFYGSIDPVNSHAVSFFAASLFLAVLLEEQVRWFQVGCVLGLVALIRTQDVLIGISAIPLIKPKYIPLYIAGVAYIFAPQLLVWQILNDSFWKSPYISSIEGFRFFDPHILGVLFSKTNGLFLWTPLTLLGIVGLLIKKTNSVFITFASICLMQILLVSVWSVWWQGASYSGRMFVGCLPLMAFGIAKFITFVQKKAMNLEQILLSIVYPLCVINMILIVYFLLSTR